jgi:hypothetical protein
MSAEALQDIGSGLGELPLIFKVTIDEPVKRKGGDDKQYFFEQFLQSAETLFAMRLLVS